MCNPAPDADLPDPDRTPASLFCFYLVPVLNRHSRILTELIA